VSEPTDLVLLLDTYGVTAAELVEQVPHVFGPPRWVALVGSVAAGYGNAESDLDLYAIVDHPGVSPIPIPACVGSRRVDVRFFDRGAVDAWLDRLASLGRGEGIRSRDDYVAYRFSAEHASRAALSMDLYLDDPDLPAQVDSLRRSCPGALGAFWEMAAARQLTMLELGLMHGASPRYLRHRAFATGCALLESAAARRGAFYYGSKWVGEKATRVGLVEEWKLVLQAMLPATSIDGLLPGCTELAVRLDVDPGQWHEAMCVSVADDTTIHELFGRFLLSRWRTRATWLDAGDPETAVVEASVRAGPGTPVSLPIGSGLVGRLLCEDMLWLGCDGIRS
jgi:hypothetical protein